MKDYTVRLVSQKDAVAFFNLLQRNKNRLEDFFAGTIRCTQTLQETIDYCKNIEDRIERKEYLPYLKDTHGRFPPLESIASTNNFLQLPVVDIWAYRFLDKLKERFPAIVSKKRKFQHTSIIDVTSSHCFAHRGPVRSIAGLLYDLGTLKWKRVVQRTSVWLKIIKDPYNNYEDLIEIQKKYQYPHQKQFLNLLMIFYDYAVYKVQS